MLDGTWPTIYSYKIIPAVYNEALSYWQQIEHLCKSVNSVIQYIQQMDLAWENGDSETLAQAKAYADLIKTTLDAEFDDFVKQINQLLAEAKADQDNFKLDINNQIANNMLELKQYVEQETTGLHHNVTALWLAMNYLFYQQDASFKKLGAALKQYIEDTTAYMTGARITVNNPIHGNVTTLNAALNDLMNYISTIGSITMRQYDSLKITMADYDNMEITALDYRLKAYFIFFKQLELMDYMASVDKQFNGIQGQLDTIYGNIRMYNPYVGEETLVKDVVAAQTGLLGGAPTMAEYREFKQHFNQFDDYNALHLTMAEYRQNGVGKYLYENITHEPGNYSTWQVYTMVHHNMASIPVSPRPPCCSRLLHNVRLL